MKIFGTLPKENTKKVPKMLSWNNSILVLVLSLNIVCNGQQEVYQQKVVVNSSELCIIPITPSHFRWEKQQGSVNEIEYSAKISNSPDLPEWLAYTYDGANSIGYLYGVPPERLISINLDVIGWNRYQNYDVRKLIISMDIMRKDTLEYIVEVKIDNLNVRDLAIPRKMHDLINLFTDQFDWIQNNGGNVLPVYLASAVEVGENRVPLRPNQAEGVVVHLASDKDFSAILKKLQVEISPLWKMRPCPRDMKRTSMERHFRRYNFLVDWCSFRLSTLSGLHLTQVIGGKREEEAEANVEVDLNDSNIENQKTKPIVAAEPDIFTFRSAIPERSYGMEILLATVIPGSIGGLVGFVLIALLWADRDEDAPIYKNGNGNGNGNGSGGGSERQFIYHQSQPQEGIIVLARDDTEKDDEPEDERDLMSTPLPPQYGETHPNGAPALTYAV